MNIKEIAEKLVTYCREGREKEGLGELYHPNAVSVEAVAGPDGSREAQGVEAISGKHEWWANSFEVHSGNVGEPMFHGEDRFAVIFEIDATERASGQRNHMKEVALYTVENGKISKEEFFY